MTWSDCHSSSWLTVPGVRVTMGVTVERTLDLICGL